MNTAKTSGISWIYDADDECYVICNIFVAVEDRRKGMGSQLIAQAIKEMKADGQCNVVKLSVDSDSVDHENPVESADLVEFYESNGFDLEYAGEIIVMSRSI